MVDIIDVILARALTPQGQIENYAAQSQQAVTRANSAISSIETITQQTAANNEQAQETLSAAQTALTDISALEERVEAALQSLQSSSTTQIWNEMDKLAITLYQTDNSSYNSSTLTFTMPSGEIKTINNLIKMYASIGQNIDGTMTQKAITDAINNVQNTLETRISNITINQSSGEDGISNLGIDAAGHIVIVGPDGTIQAGDATEQALIEALIKTGTYSTEGTVGLIIDYANKSFQRAQDSANYSAGADFNAYAMYGGRMRCNVADDGTINAFYGDSNYTEDGSNGQVMIYQPKFYYQRTIIESEINHAGTFIRKENLILSAQKYTGFKLAPLFLKNNEELDYVLLPAYEGSIYDTSAHTYLLNNENGINISEDKISSVAGVKPFNGINNNLTLVDVKRLAANRGEGWQLTTMEAESALQMLGAVEFGTLNGQGALELGIVNINRANGADCSAITGSTSSLGNASGAATSTIIDNNGTKTTYSTAGSRAISYRGMENPWGNLWRLIANCTIRGSGSNSGMPYYNGLVPLNYTLPYASADWVSAFGYGNPDYDWIYLPIECSTKANSALPVGDSLWSVSNLNGENLIGIGGLCASSESAGLFHYCADISSNSTLKYFNGRIMFVPTKNAIYLANINKWRQHYGG